MLILIAEVAARAHHSPARAYQRSENRERRVDLPRHSFTAIRFGSQVSNRLKLGAALPARNSTTAWSARVSGLGYSPLIETRTKRRIRCVISKLLSKFFHVKKATWQYLSSPLLGGLEKISTRRTLQAGSSYEVDISGTSVMEEEFTPLPSNKLTNMPKGYTYDKRSCLRKVIYRK